MFCFREKAQPIPRNLHILLHGILNRESCLVGCRSVGQEVDFMILSLRLALSSTAQIISSRSTTGITVITDVILRPPHVDVNVFICTVISLLFLPPNCPQVERIAHQRQLYKKEETHMFMLFQKFVTPCGLRQGFPFLLSTLTTSLFPCNAKFIVSLE